jgi:uncharacterized repeat protein (TIGR01451 family)
MKKGLVRMTRKLISPERFRGPICAWLAALLWLLPGPAFGVGAWLQGQDKGDTNTWKSVNLQNWAELDYIPFRVFFDPSSAGSHTITVDFVHLVGTTPGFEDLTSFASFTTNLVITAGPTLKTDPAGVWTYTFTVNISDNNSADVRFLTRLAAGAHINTGSSLQLRSSAGNVQIHKPAPCPDAIDLAIVKTGPATVLPGGLLTYTLSYTNKTGSNTANGAQICDILPANVVTLTNSLSTNCHLVGYTIFFDLMNLAPHASGQISFQVQVPQTITDLTVLTNFAEILSCGDDLNMTDNTSTWLTTVCGLPGITTDPTNALRCAGQRVTFSVVASGSSPLSYQWRKNGNNILGATNSSYSIASAAVGDAGSYDVVISNPCGTATSGAATLTVNQNVVISNAPMSRTNCSGTTASFSVSASGTGLSYQWFKGTGALSGETGSSLTLTNVSTADAGTYSVVVSATCGGPVTNSASLVVSEPPTITTSSDKTVEAGSTWTFDTPIANYPITVLTTVTNPAGQCTFMAKRTWQAMDSCGNTAQSSQTVTVVDTSTPTVTCPPDVTVAANAGCAATGVILGNPVASDNCSVVSVTNNAPSSFPLGTNLVTWTATDSSGNASSCVQRVTVVDTNAPTISCPADVTVSANAGCTATGVTLGSPVTSDNCSVASATNNAPASFPLGTNLVTWTVTDSSGNTSSCVQRVIVRDTSAPTISCPADVTASANAGCAATNVTLGNPVTSDNCSVASVTNNAPASFPVGTTLVTWSVTDSSGNANSCVQRVLVLDTNAPTISCPADVTVSANAGCAATNVTLGNPVTSDNCSVASVTNNAPASFPLGTTLVTWTVTDSSGNANSCVQRVLVLDTNAPTISCPADVTVSANSGCTATNVTLGNPVTSDNCSVASETNNAPASYPLGTTLVTWTVTDSSGNASSCVQRVTVVDTNAPTISCPADVTVSANASCTATGVTLGSPVTSDNCSVASVTNNAPVSYALGTTLVTWTVTDSSGNANSCVQRVTVVDTNAPTISCPADVTVSANAGCAATNVTLGNPVTSDNCSVASVTNNAPASYPLGTNLVTWTVTNSSGNANSCVQRVTVVDTSAPTISCPADVTVSANAGCAATNVTLGNPVTSDNCSVASVTNNAPVSYALGTNLVTWTVTDSSGNANSCVQRVTVVDTSAPTISCPADVTVSANAGCAATNVTLGNPVTGDNCSVASVTNNAPVSCALGTNLVTWTVTDSSGNTSSCVQRVIVVDTNAPTISCPADVTVSANAGCAATNVTLGNPVTSDNCSVASVTNNAPASYPLGTTLVTWTVTDSSGNANSCVQRVTIVDTNTPTISCPADVTVSANAGCAATNVTLGNPVTSDNCSVASVTNNAPASYPPGTTLVTWTVTDSSGNANSCVQRVTIVDTNAPTISCPADVTVSANAGCAATSVALGNPVTGDNCSVVAVTNNAPASFPLGTNLVTWTVTDSSGNTSSCVQRVIVVDTNSPTITCPGNRTVAAGTEWTFDGPPSASDNCGVPTVSIVSTVTNLGCGHTLTATRTWQAADASGNSSTCTQTVTVVDTTAPTVSILSPTNGQVFLAPAAFTLLADAHDTGGTIAKVEFFSGTNLLGVVTNDAPYFVVVTNLPAGSNYSFSARATDGCGNMATSAPVSITVLPAPLVTVVSLTVNQATSLYEQRVRVSNPTDTTFDIVRVYITGLSSNVTVYNPSGTLNGVPYVQSSDSVAPGTYRDFTIEYYTTHGAIPNPALRGEFMSLAPHAGGDGAATGFGQPIHRIIHLPTKSVLLEFATLSNRVYYVEYSADLKNWKNALPAITGTGTWYEWVDNGLPSTDGPPAGQPCRFYRVIVLP